MSFRVVEPGLQTLVVDFGRPHCRSLGVPVGGAADRTSLALGNALVGNEPDAAALEFCLAGPTLEAQCELACVVCGAPFDLHSTRQTLRVGRTFTLESGEVLEVGGTTSGMRAYLCVAGGIQQKIILGSRSSLDAVNKGDTLQCNPGRIARRFVWEAPPMVDTFDRGSVLRVVAGPQADWFPADRLDLPQAIPGFVVTPDSNRMGIRLRRPEPLRTVDRELVSEPVCPGSVQVTRDGQLIILGVDGQTIGGYPKIAQVISADIDKMGQLRPGEEVRFQRVTLEEAEALWSAKQKDLHHWVTRMRVSLAGITPVASR